MTIAQRIEHLRQQIPPQVRLIAVTKQVSIEKIREAYQAGLRDFAENRWQEALIKQEELQDLGDICWHFIGHLQANKAKKVLEHFEWVHSVDNLPLAQRLDRLTVECAKSINICLQVKVLPDPNKYGWVIPALLEDLPALEHCQHLKIQGLMTILPLGLTQAQRLEAFKQTKDLAEQINQRSRLQLHELSMGMSDDYLEAVEAGATAIRLGSIIFGQRV